MPPDASLLRQIEQAVSAKAGTIVVQEVRSVSSDPPVGAFAPPNPAVNTYVMETPAGSGPPNYLNVNVTPMPGKPAALGITGGVEKIYDAKTDTVHAASIWGPYIKPGLRRGTFVYTPPTRSLWAPDRKWLFDGFFPSEPLTMTVAQARTVLDGSDTIAFGKASAGKPVARFPFGTTVQGLWGLLISHDLRVVGPATVDGRRAIELTGPKYKCPPGSLCTGGGMGVKYWVDAKTYAPIKYAFDAPPHGSDSETWLEYKTLPATLANERLLSPLSLHPHARVDRNYKDFINTTYNWFALQNPAVSIAQVKYATR